MRFLRQNVGIDIAKDSFVATYCSVDSNQDLTYHSTQTFINNEKGFDLFIDWTNQFKEVELTESYTMEATGVYYEKLAYYLNDKDKSIHVLLPNKAKKFGESLNVKSKTDNIDSKVLAQMGVERKLENWKLCSKQFRNLRTLTREREQLISQRSGVKNQIHAEKHTAKPLYSTIRRMNSLLLFLNKQIIKIEIELKKIIAADTELSKKVENIISIPGLGFITAVVIIAETQGFVNVKNIKQLISYAGLDVAIKESGKWTGKPRISKKGNSRIRKALYMASISSIKHNKQYKTFYERVTPKKVNGLIALTAIQRKMLGLIYTLWKNDAKYDSDYGCKG